MVLDILYKCLRVVQDKTLAGVFTAEMIRVDGSAGWLKISGLGADELLPGKRYLISKAI